MEYTYFLTKYKQLLLIVNFLLIKIFTILTVEYLCLTELIRNKYNRLQHPSYRIVYILSYPEIANNRRNYTIKNTDDTALKRDRINKLSSEITIKQLRISNSCITFRILSEFERFPL